MSETSLTLTDEMELVEHEDLQEELDRIQLPVLHADSGQPNDGAEIHVETHGYNHHSRLCCCGAMLEGARERWSTLGRDTKRLILALVLVSAIVSIVVIASVSSSAGSGKPEPEQSWQDIRLPTNVIPRHYDVSLKISLTEEWFTGKEEILVDVVENETSTILLHINSVRDKVNGYEMNVTSYAVHQVKGEELSEVKVQHAYPYSANSFFVMDLARTIPVGSYRLTLEWRSRLVYGLDGIYISSYEEGNTTKKLLASQMEPLAARKVMPCFDEPDLKATFKMQITTEKKYPLVLWNMPQEGDPVEVDDQFQTFNFKYDPDVPMSTYLLAFIIADFHCTAVQKTDTGVAVRTCGRPGPMAEGDGDYSATKTKEIIEVYEQFYGTQFPLEKIDSVAVPDFSAGAMENWGLILYRETALLYNDKANTLGNKARVNTVVAHELAHQWFGNLVTMKWWNDLWLNEGFASYVEWIGTTQSEPNWNYLDFQTYSDKSSAFSIDSYMSSRPTSVAVEKPDDIESQFDSISYSKGAAILRQAKMFMDRGVADSEHFEDAIKAYINEYHYNNAVQMDLYGEMDKMYQKAYPSEGVNITDVMSTWTLQMNFPVLRVRRYDENTIAVSQERFLIAGEETSGDKASPYSYQWFVPVQYKKKGDVEATFVWLKPHSSLLIPFNFSDASNFIRLNINSDGYYIVDYDYDLQERLNTELFEENAWTDLNVSEQQGLLFDTFLMISSGRKPMSVGLALIGEVLGRSDLALVPWKEVQRQLAMVGRQISGNATLVGEWKAKWRKPFEDLYDEYKQYFAVTGATDLPEDDADGNFQKRQMIQFAVSAACQYEVTACVEAAKEFFNKYKSEEKYELPTDFKGTILQTVMSQDIDEQLKLDWDWLWGKYLASDSAAEKTVMYYALGLIQDYDTLWKFSEYCLNVTMVRPSDALYIMGRSITQTKLGRDVSWDFMKANWDDLHQTRFTGALFSVDAYVSGVLSKFSDVETYNEIKEFFTPRYESLGPGTSAYESSLQSIQGNIAWLAKHGEAVKKYVKSP